MEYTPQAFEKLSAETASRIMESGESWTSFLSVAARLYKYTFQEQLLIYAQRPDATACAPYEIWNDRMRRYVKRGSKGIALIDEERVPPKLRYVFDISDTGTTQRSIIPFVWQYHGTSTDAAVLGLALEDRFGVSRTKSVAEQLTQIAEQLTNAYWNENRFDILSACSGSSLEKDTSVTAAARFRIIATASAAYTMMLRTGLPTEKYYRPSDFTGITSFDTEPLRNALGESVNASCGEALRFIENIMKQAEAERRLQQKESEENNNERDHLHAGRGLSVAEHRPEAAGERGDREIRANAVEVPEGASEGSVHELAVDEQIDRTPAGDRAGGAEPAGPADAAVGEGSGSDGSAESDGPDEMGRADEHLQSAGGGDHQRGLDLQLTESPSDDEPESGQLTFEWLSTEEQEQSGAGMPRFDAEAFEKLLPHGMRFKEADLVNGDEVYWVTQAPFSLEQLKEFQQAVRDYTGDIQKFYVTYRGLSYGYNFEEDLANKVLAVVTPLQILDDDYIRAMQDEGLDDVFLKQGEQDVSPTEPVTEAENVPFSVPYRSYSEIKHDNPDSIVLFQVGDFFEMYGKDAEDAVEVLDLRLTSRAISANERVPMCGVPAHSLEAYVENLRDHRFDVVLASFEDGHYTTRTLRATGAETPESKTDPSLSIMVNGEWKSYPNVEEAEKASLEAFKNEVHRTAQNFRIADGQTVEGGPKAKYRANVTAIRLLKTLEAEEAQATPDQQTVLSRYVGWGGLPDAFDETKEGWRNEFNELRELLTPEEYAAARSSTLTAFYTPPFVIRAIYDAVGSLGFTSGNILEPAMGVGAFFGLLPERMQESRLYGVELDSITGRIAKQLYPKAHITVAGFETTDRRDFFDLAVGNVPFGGYTVNDKAYNNLGFAIHDYFFAKTLGQVRPGGLIAFVTSRFTMDKETPEVRRYIAERAELLGAIRLPNNAFRATAGTDVVSDILFLQKREQAIVLENEPSWVGLGKTADGFTMNAYFVEHPEMVLGRLAYRSTQYGKDELTVLPIENADLSDQLQTAIQNIRGAYRDAEIADIDEKTESAETIPADPDVKNYSFTVVNGEVYFREESVMTRSHAGPTAIERIKGMVELRDTVRAVLDMQLDEFTTDEELHQKQEELSGMYDRFTKKYGLLHDRANKAAFAQDNSYYLLTSLEILDDNGKLERKADLFTKRTVSRHRVAQHVNTAVEALEVSIAEKARVDMEYMSELSGKSEQALAEDLRGVVFRNPAWENSKEAQKYLPADEYLSGNIREKLAWAKWSAESDPEIYTANVEALERVQPKDLEASEIDVRLGATWIDKEYVQQFLWETFEPSYWCRERLTVQYSELTGVWQIDNKSLMGRYDIKSNVVYGTSRANAYRLLEDALNLRDTKIYDTIEDPDGTERRVLNKNETVLAAQKQQLIRDRFKDWIWQDPERRQTLVEQYNVQFNSVRPREYDGSHLVFPGMSAEIELREHQRNAIARILYGGNTLLAHEVGAGKTFEMVAAVMESKRLGLCTKSLIVVPNHLIEQWASEFLRLYANANLLVANKKDFEPKNRKRFCARIATGNYDAIIIGQSMFEKIPISEERQERLITQQIEEITNGIKQIRMMDSSTRFTVKQMEATRKSLQARLEKLTNSDVKDDVVTFEELGVDRLFIDESDNYKNLFLYTKMNNVAGLSTSDAQKSSDLFLKCRYMDELTNGHGVIFATGTPVSNSMTEVYTIQRYLQYDVLQRMNMIHFDAWAAQFGETVTTMELAPEGTGYRARTRFARFFNLPELMNIFKEVADIKTADELNLPTPDVEHHVDVAKPTETQKAYMQVLSKRAAKVHGGSVTPSEDNMLKITSDGRKIGTDQRILDPTLPDEPGTKVNLCVENVLRYWRDGEADKLTQLVFCDISTPTAEKDGFTIYDDLRKKLVAGGIPKEQVAFIHEANTDTQKEELFRKVRTGAVRVLIGSTQKMGAGTNVQDRLIALHDLDCPWRPRDLTQREGRIRRRGNQNKVVHVHRYVTEGTFDAYLWQTIEKKQRFISQIMTSKTPLRSCEDVDEVTLTFAEIKALCAGDPRIKERMELDVDVSRLKLLKASYQSNRYRLEDQLTRYYPEALARERESIAAIKADLQSLAAQPQEDGFPGMQVGKTIFAERESAGNCLLERCQLLPTGKEETIGSFRSFELRIRCAPYTRDITALLCGHATYSVELGESARGNITRIENLAASIPERLTDEEAVLSTLEQQERNAKAELETTFPQEQELEEKTARLIELDAELDMGGGQKSKLMKIRHGVRNPCRYDKRKGVENEKNCFAGRTEEGITRKGRYDHERNPG